MSAPESAPVGGTVHLEVPKPIWYRPAFGLAIVFAAAAMLLFALGQWQNGEEARRAAHQARQTAGQIQAQNVELKAQVKTLTLSGECRSKRSGDAVNAIGALVGNMSDLVGLLAARDTSAAIGELLTNRTNLSDDYKAKAAALSAAVDECKGK